jgi:hypothetical protein
LGLFISKSIIEAHGGKIWAKNNSDGQVPLLHLACLERNKKVHILLVLEPIQIIVLTNWFYLDMLFVIHDGKQSRHFLQPSLHFAGQNGHFLLLAHHNFRVSRYGSKACIYVVHFLAHHSMTNSQFLSKGVVAPEAPISASLCSIPGFIV